MKQPRLPSVTTEIVVDGESYTMLKPGVGDQLEAYLVEATNRTETDRRGDRDLDELDDFRMYLFGSRSGTSPQIDVKYIYQF